MVGEGRVPLSIRFAACIACVLAAPAVVAGHAWESRGPYGGHVNEIVSRSDNPDLVFAVAVGGLFRSLDRGQHWSRADLGLRNSVGGVSGRLSGTIALDPIDPSGAWLFDDGGVVYRSTDTGETWNPTGFVLTGASLLTLAVDAASPQHVYIGTSNGILRSDDLGATFVPLGDGVSPNAAHAILVDPADPTHVMAAGAWDAAFPARPFFYSHDGGASWWPAISPCDDGVILCTGVRDMSPTANGGALGASTGFVAFSDDGAEWSLGKIFGNVTSVSTNGAQAALVGGDFGVGFTTDLFATSELVDDGLSLDGITPLEVQSTRLYPGYPARGPWFTGTYIDGVYRSDDDGASWHATNDGLAATRITSLAIDPNDAGHALAGVQFTGSFMGGRAMWATSLHGDLWVPVAEPPDAYSIRDIEYDPTMSGASTTIYATGIYAGPRGVTTPTSGLYKTTNGGVDWTVLDGGLPPPYGFAGAMWKLAIDPRSCAAPPPQGTCTDGPLQVLYVTSTALTTATSTRSHGAWSRASTPARRGRPPIRASRRKSCSTTTR